MRYIKPKQSRAIATEQRILDTLQNELMLHGYKGATIEQISAKSNTSRSVFLKRFGSKEQALLILYKRYCDETSTAMKHFIQELPRFGSLREALYEISSRFEDLLCRHYASNRAMHEHFQKSLDVHPLTQGIFKECVEMMTTVQQHFDVTIGHSASNAWSASQLLVTINYNYVTAAMPGLPRETGERHLLLSRVLEVALRDE